METAGSRGEASVLDGLPASAPPEGAKQHVTILPMLSWSRENVATRWQIRALITASSVPY